MDLKRKFPTLPPSGIAPGTRQYTISITTWLEEPASPNYSNAWKRIITKPHTIQITQTVQIVEDRYLLLSKATNPNSVYGPTTIGNHNSLAEATQHANHVIAQLWI